MNGLMDRTSLRARLESDAVSIGTRIQAPWPGFFEIVGQLAVFDYVEFLAEYAPYDLHDLDNMARAAELHALPMMIKIDAESRGFVAQRAMAAGIQNLLFADVRSVKDAKEAVNAVRPEPEHNNGVRSDRRNGYLGGYASPEEVVDWCDDAVIAIMVEKQETVENLEDILAIGEIDMVQFGSSDYSLSIGKPGAYNDDQVLEAERKTIETALEYGVAPRAEINHPDAAEKYLEMGVRDFNLNKDIRIIHDWLHEHGNQLADKTDEYSR
jgi:2-keto-3-deoxy-L-rhamnonate aldolase RhmA